MKIAIEHDILEEACSGLLTFGGQATVDTVLKLRGAIVERLCQINTDYSEGYYAGRRVGARPLSEFALGRLTEDYVKGYQAGLSLSDFEKLYRVSTCS